MENNKFKKLMASMFIITFFAIYAAPVALCSPIGLQAKKPSLRESSEVSSLKLEGDISITKKNPQINLSLRNSDVRQVLRMFADQAGLNIIFHQNVSGSVTLDLVNVPLNDAFKMVMQITDLTYFVDKNTMIVMLASDARNTNIAKQEMITIPVKYCDANVLARFLNNNIFSINKPGLSNSQIAITNPSTNEILIFGTTNDYLMAKKIIDQLDKKPRQQTFIVNHTTPKEMAELICSTLLDSLSSTSSSGSSSNSSSNSSFNSSSRGSENRENHDEEDQRRIMEERMMEGRMTGQASAIDSDSGGGDSGGSSGSDSMSAITLGSGVIACQYNNTINAGSLTSLPVRSLTVTYFPQKGTIEVMGGSVQQMEMIKDFIANNDKKQPQAYLEISIIELNETGSREFSNNWNMWSSFFSGGFDGELTTNQWLPTFLKGDSYDILTDKQALSYTMYKYTGAPIITYAVNYLIKNGKGRILANPRILITNGETSIIDLSSDYIKTVKSEVLTSNGEAGATQKTYEIGDDEGIIVEMVPFISPDGYVTLNIKPEYSTVKEKVTEYNSETDQNDLVATLLQRRNLDLKNVRIKDGETLVIGGMIREEEQKIVSKIPVLGDLPGVGMFFRNTNSEKEKQELVIMITPKIVKDTEDLVQNQGTTL